MSTIRINKLEDLAGNNGVFVSDLGKSIDGGLRILTPSPTLPDVRDNGKPLQVGDVVTNLSDGLEYKYTGSGWLSTDISKLLSPTGASSVGYGNRTVKDKLDDFVNITDYYISTDNNQWQNAYNRAIAVSTKVHFPLKTNPIYIFGASISLPNEGTLSAAPGVTLSAIPATNSTGTGIVTILNTSGKRGLKLLNIKIDGGVREMMVDKSYSRPVRFTGCYDVQCIGLEIINNPDWSLSFEQCQKVNVFSYKQRSYVYADPAVTLARAGGRDGLHFLDCKDVYAYDLDIESGDDCVGITSELTGCYNINIRGVRGTSVSSSLVIYNEEHAAGSSTDYVAMPMIGLTIEDVQTKYGAVARNVVRVAKYNPLSTLKDISIKGVRGSGTAHALWLYSAIGVRLSDIDVISTSQHGVYLNKCERVVGNISGKSLLSGFDGVNITEGSGFNLIVSSDSSANYGMHVIRLKDSVLIPNVTNCGSLSFSSSSGGNARVIDSVNVEVPYGVLSGDPTISYFGLLTAGNLNCRFGKGLLTKGFINSAGLQNPISTYQEPSVVVRFGEAVDGTLTIASLLNCSVTRVSVGRYQINFNTNMKSTLFNYQVTAIESNAVRNYKLIGGATQSSITIATVDSTGAEAKSSMVSFFAYDS